MAESNAFACLDELVIDHIASFLNIHSVYRWVCACEESVLLSPEWFFQNTLPSDGGFHVVPLDEYIVEYFYLAEMMNQMRKCRFIPKYCFEHRSEGISGIAKWLKVDSNSVYAERMAMLVGRLVHNAQTVALSKRRDRFGESHIHLCDAIDAARSFGFHGNLPPHDRIFEVIDDTGNPDFVTLFEIDPVVDPCVYSIDDAEAAMLKSTEYFSTLEENFRSGSAEADVLASILEDVYAVDVEDDEIDTEEWLVNMCPSWDEDWQVDEYLQRYGESPQEEAESQMQTILETLRNQQEVFAQLSLEEFGICEAQGRLSTDKMKQFLRVWPSNRWSDSAVRFFQLLIEEVHFGSVLEARVIKEGPINSEWDYGVLFGKRGAVLRNLRLSDDDDDDVSTVPNALDEECEDENYVGEIDEDEDFVDEHYEDEVSVDDRSEDELQQGGDIMDNC